MLRKNSPISHGLLFEIQSVVHGKMRRVLLMVCGLGVAGLVLGARMTHVPLRVQEDVAFAQVERVGSFPGDTTIELKVLWNATEWSLEEYPPSFSNTSTKLETNDDKYREIVYFAGNFSVHDFVFNETTINSMGLHKDGDFFKQWEWLEICPRQQQLVFHSGSRSDDITNHRCSGGSKTPLKIFKDCSSPSSCPAANQATDIEVHYFKSTKVKKVFDVNAVHVDDAGAYAVYDRDDLLLYKEFDPKHTHSWEAFLLIESHLIFFLHFVSDRKKDLNNVWTRAPILYGSCFSVLSSVFLYKMGGIDERLFHRSTFFRHGDRASVFSTILLIATCLSAFSLQLTIALHLKTNGDKTKKMVQRTLIQLFYEMCLMIPLTLVLMGGSKTNLLNLFLIFVLTMVVWGSRVRDAIHAYCSFKDFFFRGKTQSALGVFSLLLAWFSVGVWAVLAISTVWIPTTDSIFLLKTNSLTGAFSTLSIFTAVAWRFFRKDFGEGDEFCSETTSGEAKVTQRFTGAPLRISIK